MDMVVLVAISRVSDGLVNWLSLSRACDGCGCVVAIIAGMRWTCIALGCHFAGKRWTWYIGSGFRGHAMDGDVFVAIVAGMRRTWLLLVAITWVSDGLVNWLSLSRVCDGCGCVVATAAGMRSTCLLLVAISRVSDGNGTLVVDFAGMRWMGLFCCHGRGYAMDMVALVAISRVSDGHGTFVITFVGMRWM